MWVSGTTEKAAVPEDQAYKTDGKVLCHGRELHVADGNAENGRRRSSVMSFGSDRRGSIVDKLFRKGSKGGEAPVVGLSLIHI